MNVRCAQIIDLPRLKPCFESFSTASRFFRGFEMARFVEAWTQFITSGIGTIFILENGSEPVGALGAVIYPDIYSGRPIATEFFWFTLPDHRGHGMSLYKAFESWARQRGCSELRMVHMLDSMPEALHRTYKRLGYEAAEVHYTKELY